MNVSCPQCHTRYQLPDALLGTAGARVRCPRCQHAFLVGRDGKTSAAAQASTPAPAHAQPSAPGASGGVPVAVPFADEASAAPAAHAGARPGPASVAAAMSAPPAAAFAAPPDADPRSVARAVLDELAGSHGSDIEDAIARGRLFSEHGQRLVDAYDEYRRRTQRRVEAGPFREALRERWGVDLTPHWEER